MMVSAPPFADYDTRLAAYAVIMDDRERILLALWNGPTPPLWTMPGGGVELHETVESAVAREVFEETGFQVRLGQLLGIDTEAIPPEARYFATRWLKSVRVVFEADVIGGALAREIGGTTDEARWFALDEVAALNRVALVDRALRMYRAARVASGARHRGAEHDQ